VMQQFEAAVRDELSITTTAPKAVEPPRPSGSIG
jgi:hypothetical protein